VFAQSGEKGEGTCTERTVGFHCDWLKNIRVGEARIFYLMMMMMMMMIIIIIIIS